MGNDDDKPLFSLATLSAASTQSKKSSSAPGAGRGRPPAAAASSASSGSASVPAAPKAPPVRTVSAPAAPKAKVAAGSSPPAAGTLKRKAPSPSPRASDDEQSDDDGDDDEASLEKKRQKELERDMKKKADRSKKDELIAKLLKRWWYVLPFKDPGTWPPEDENFYKAELARRRHRVIPVEKWDFEPDKDHKGDSKVYALEQFRGLYRDIDGTLIDLRPQDTCPCYANMKNRSEEQIVWMLWTALKNQLKELLEKSPFRDTMHDKMLAGEIEKDIKKYEERAQRYEKQNGKPTQ